MTIVRLFRGSDADGTGYSPEIREEMNLAPKRYEYKDGEPSVFNDERINAQLKTIQDVSNEAFNEGIDKAKELVSKYENATSKPFLKSLIKEIIEKLQSLKKK